MEMTEKKKKKKHRYTPILIFLLLILYFIIQGYLINRNKIETVKATEGFINDSILSSGIICREEVILTDQFEGAVNYHIDDGQRVSGGMLIGEIYPSTGDIENIIRAKALTKELENINTAENFMSSGGVDISVTRKQLNNSIIDVSQGIATGNYRSVLQALPGLNLNINKINVATGKAGDFEVAKSDISTGIEAAKQTISAPIGTLSSQYAGYFIKGVDGYEEVAKVDNFKAISDTQGYDIISKPNLVPPVEEYYGKIITDYKWKLCTYVSCEEAEKLKAGLNVKLALSSEQTQYQKATVSEIIPFDNRSLVILQSSTMDEKSATLRITDCEILFRQYKGIKIPKSALHIVDENLGVYVKFSKLVQFKKVKPIFEDSNYVILPIASDENNEVSLFDDVIVKGVNLYDGKYL
ncbi:MAG: HlyD family efflux transporter periplasmic adaptor subunit [Oscillospiraceae bacterium]